VDALSSAGSSDTAVTLMSPVTGIEDAEVWYHVR
jgi:hypothetical protein